MNAKVDAKNVLWFLLMVIICYVLSPIYTFLAGWDLADNDIIKSIQPKGLKVLSTFALLLFFTSLYKCWQLICLDEIISGELLGIIIISILPIWVNLMYVAYILSGI